MAINYASTSYQHPDYKTQREFERVAKAFHQADKELKNINTTLDSLSPLAKKLWELAVKHNGTSIQLPTENIDFLDTDFIKWKIQKWDNKTARVSIDEEALSELVDSAYHTLWEKQEDNTYAIDAGTALESLDGVGDVTLVPNTQKLIINRDPQGTYRGYPSTNVGKGWIPVTCNSEVHTDIDNYVNNSIVLPYINTPAIWTNQPLIFSPTVSGIYKFDISMFLRIALMQAITPALMFYDSIDKIMLIAEKTTTDILTDLYEYRNPFKIKKVAVALADNTSDLMIIDSDTRYNHISDDTGITLVYNNLPGYLLTTTPDGYSDTSGACSNGLFYNREVHVGGSCEMYLESGDSVIFWYKVYAHRSYIDTSYYTRFVPENYDDDTPPAVITGDYIAHIEDRYQRIAVQCINSKDTFTETNRENTRNIISRF